jgi:hypothetical protein
MDNSLAGYHFFFAAFAFVLGAVVGSFLNVCIYRMPLDLSVNEPRRSFCPSCKYQIPFWHNIPLVSWLFCGARCANCGSRCLPLLRGGTPDGSSFLAVWPRFHGQIALAYWVLFRCSSLERLSTSSTSSFRTKSRLEEQSPACSRAFVPALMSTGR